MAIYFPATAALMDGDYSTLITQHAPHMAHWNQFLLALHAATEALAASGASLLGPAARTKAGRWACLVCGTPASSVPAKHVRCTQVAVR